MLLSRISVFTSFIFILTSFSKERIDDDFTNRIYKRFEFNNKDLIFSWFRSTFYRGKSQCRSISVRPFLHINTTRNHYGSILLVLVIASGDIELNPGPTNNFPAGISTDCTKTIRQLQKLHHKLISSELHEHFLSLYKIHNITPPGLKIRLEPQVGNSNILHKWIDVLKESSNRLLDLLIESHETKCVTLRKQIANQQSILSNNLSSLQLEEIKHWLEIQNENTRDRLSYRKQQKLDKHLGFQEHNAHETTPPLSRTTIWNDYETAVNSPQPKSTSLSRDHQKSENPLPKLRQSSTHVHRHHKPNRRRNSTMQS